MALYRLMQPAYLNLFSGFLHSLSGTLLFVCFRLTKPLLCLFRLCFSQSSIGGEGKMMHLSKSSSEHEEASGDDWGETSAS